MAEPLPRRVQILTEAARVTGADRNLTYGDPAINLACAGHLKATLRHYMQREVSEGELEALDAVCVKLARAVTGPVSKEDTYLDGAAYFAIAGELWEKAERERLEKQVSAEAVEIPEFLSPKVG